MIKFIQTMLDRELSSADIAALLAKQTGGKPSEESKRLAGILQSFISSLPGALKVIMAMTKDRRCGRIIRLAAGQVFYYLLDEDDLFPEEEFGIIGLVDDAYMVHSFTIMLKHRYAFVDTAKIAYTEPSEQTLQVIRTLLPPGIADSLINTCNQLLDTSSALIGINYESQEPPGEIKPYLRVNETLTALKNQE